ncbi:MAG TPA: glycosyltransferase family 4 protein [Burkholderiales bacterium]|nr:glycosyltransferase family 4 protein [Burkholderiales bacterium]
MVELAVILPTRVFGGHEKMLVGWLRSAVERHGLRVTIYASENPQLARECEAAGLGRPVVTYRGPAAPLRDFCVTWRLLGRVPADAPLLLAPGALQQALLQWLATFLRRRSVAGYVPMAYASRHMRFRGGWVRDWIAGSVIRRVDLWITITAEQRALLLERWRVPSAAVFVVPNRLPFLDRDGVHAPALEDRRLHVLFAGRFDPCQKGLDWLCDVLRARASDWVGRVRFTFKGHGRFEAELLRLRRDLGNEHVDVQPWGDVGTAMAQADVLLLPSRYEGLPLVALEAAHYGVAIAASKGAGLSGLVPPSCLFEFGDERGLWTALQGLSDAPRRAAAVAFSRNRVRQTLSPASFRDAVERVVVAFARMPGDRRPAG